LTLALIFNSRVQHPKSSLLLTVLYKSSYLQFTKVVLYKTLVGLVGLKVVATRK